MTTDRPSRITRVAQIAMIVNAVLHAIGTVGMGMGPHAPERAIFGRLVAAAVAAAVMFVFAAKRLARDPAIVALPLSFVLCNLAATLGDFATSHDTRALSPLLPEATFLAIYSAFAVLRVRKQTA